MAYYGMRKDRHIWILICCIVCLAGCGKKTQTQSAKEVRVPFSADSAYLYVQQQVALGARIPGSDAHAECRDWMVEQLTQWGLHVEEQQGLMPDYKGDMQLVRNIVAHIDGTDQSQKAVLLCAHWDSRPWCDEEEDYADRFEPVTGANDGASGVGVLMEVARQLQTLRTKTAFPSVDIVLFDCEDMGTPPHYTGTEREDTWCLGSQLWATRYKQSAKEKRTDYQYGILLDMVGDPSATFPREYYSMHFAQTYVERVWRMANSLGYGRYFTAQNSYPVVDDHYYVNTIADIPCVDVIDYKVNAETGFPDWWHTKRDDMRNINKQTLQAVGETVINVICWK